MLLVRRADLKDLSLVAPLFDAYRQFYEQPPDLARAERWIADRLRNEESVIFIAIDEERPTTGLGFTQLYPAFCSVAARPYFVLYDLFVAPGARRRGVGRMLMAQAREFATSAGAFRLELQTARSNDNAQRLYESLGWVRDDVYLVYTLRL